MLLALMLGVGVGTVLGLTGAGGGILAVPALVLGLGWTMTQAAPVALVAVGAAAAVGAVDGLRKGMVRYRAALLMALLGSLLAPVGVRLAHGLPEHLLVGLFSLVLVTVAVRMFLQVREQNRAPEVTAWQQKNCMLDPASRRLHWTLKCSLTLSVVGACSGLLTGLLGVGGGFILVPAFRQFTDVRLQSVVATSLSVIALVSVTAIAGAWHAGLRIPFEGYAFIAACIGGLILGRLVAVAISTKSLQLMFSALCVLVAGYMASKI